MPGRAPVDRPGAGRSLTPPVAHVTRPPAIARRAPGTPVHQAPARPVPRFWPPAIRHALTTIHGLTASLTSLSLGIARMALGGCPTVTAAATAKNTSAVQSFCSTGCTAPRNPTPAGARRQLGSPASFGANLLAGFSLFDGDLRGYPDSNPGASLLRLSLAAIPVLSIRGRSPFLWWLGV